MKEHTSSFPEYWSTFWVPCWSEVSGSAPAQDPEKMFFLGSKWVVKALPHQELQWRLLRGACHQDRAPAPLGVPMTGGEAVRPENGEKKSTGICLCPSVPQDLGLLHPCCRPCEGFTLYLSGEFLVFCKPLERAIPWSYRKSLVYFGGASPEEEEPRPTEVCRPTSSRGTRTQLFLKRTPLSDF